MSAGLECDHVCPRPCQPITVRVDAETTPMRVRTRVVKYKAEAIPIRQQWSPGQVDQAAALGASHRCQPTESAAAKST
eukprot:4514258-Alexandrium_andersonii.AAC.1